MERLNMERVVKIKNILVCDYNETLATMFCKLFEGEGYEVLGYHDYEEVVRSLPIIKPDAILLHLRSLVLPDPAKSGLEVIQCAKWWDPEAPIIVVTGGNKDCTKPAVMAGATHILAMEQSLAGGLITALERVNQGQIDPRPYVYGWGFKGKWPAPS